MPTTIENRTSFLARIEPVLAPSDQLLVMTAYDFSKEYHRLQERRDGTRYFEHPRATTLILIDEIGCIKPKMVCASFLHDAPEDTELSARDIESYFGKRVCEMVLRVTKNPKEGYVERLLKFGEWPELLVKLCDRLHNLRTMGAGTTPEWREKQYRETKEKYLVLFERLRELAPVRYTAAISLAIAEIEQHIRHGIG